MRKRITLQKNNNNKILIAGYKEFITNCKIKNLSQYTIRYYNNTYDCFCNFYNSNNLISNITKQTVDNYIIYLRDETNQNNISINTNLRGLRAILYYFMELGYMEEFKIHLIKAEKKVIETYSDEEIKILLKKPYVKSCTFLEYRNWVVINFLLATGCRANTLINIQVKDIDFNNDLITYTYTKNKHQQIVPMADSLKKVLIEYLSYRKPQKEDDYLFINAYGDKLNTQLLSANLRSYNQKRGVMKTGVHRWRHTFAKKWILSGGDIFRLQKMLGHKDLEIVKEYVEMFTNDLQKDFNEFNPLEQINNNKKKNFIKMN